MDICTYLTLPTYTHSGKFIQFPGQPRPVEAYAAATMVAANEFLRRGGLDKRIDLKPFMQRVYEQERDMWWVRYGIGSGHEDDYPAQTVKDAIAVMRAEVEADTPAPAGFSFDG